MRILVFNPWHLLLIGEEERCFDSAADSILLNNKLGCEFFLPPQSRKYMCHLQ